MRAEPDWDECVDAVLDGVEVGTREVPGLALVISDGQGREVRRAAGHADPWTDRPMGLGTRVRVASNTKTIAATALLVLVDQGRLGLDDPVAVHLPELEWLEEITVRQALGMRTGLLDYFTLAWERDGRPDVLDPHEDRGALERVQELRDAPRAHDPDAAATYSNTNYLLVHLLLERLTGRSAQRVLRDLVLAPAGLTQTSWPRRSRLAAPAASGTFGAEVLTHANPAALFCDGALSSTVGDLARWAPQVANGTLLSPALHAERLDFAPTENYPGWEYGLGLGRSGRWLGHDGEHPGYATSAYFDPTSGVTIAVVVTSYSGEEPDEPRSFGLLCQLAEVLVPGSRRPAD